ncbi:MAG: hypothetical protein M0P47_11515 [Bacteroidales bacterium]|nr:hypothetical protein [Bacteroidales bacterium]
MKTKLSHHQMFSQIREDIESIKQALFSPQFVVRNWTDQDVICDILKVTPRTLSTYREKGPIPLYHIQLFKILRLSDLAVKSSFRSGLKNNH